MANNRMYLIHRPSGTVLYLGKRLAFGWHGPIAEVNEFFDATERAEDTQLTQDDFVLAMEDCEGAPCATDEWDYNEGTMPVLRTAPLPS
jgi:hypothetical protein